MKKSRKRIYVKCENCNGYGIVADYGSLGDDFYGDKECRSCNGTGSRITYKETFTGADNSIL